MEVAEFFVDGRLARVFERVGDLGAEGGAEAGAQAQERLPEGDVAHAELCGELRLIGRFARARAEEGKEGVEEREFAGVGVVGLQSGDSAFDQGGGPFRLELRGRLGAGRSGGEAGLGSVEFQRDELDAAASFLATGGAVGVGEPVAKCAEQKRPQPSALGVCGGEEIVFEDGEKKRLRGVFRILGREAAATGEGVERIPIRGAECAERGAPGGLVCARPGGGDDGPTGGWKR